jgi:hypothetical protein
MFDGWLWRTIWIAICVAILGSAIYVADTGGVAPTRVDGTVVDVATWTRPLQLQMGTGKEHFRLVKIAVSGRSFWHSGNHALGTVVAVQVVDGRLTGIRYIDSVESPDPAASPPGEPE